VNPSSNSSHPGAKGNGGLALESSSGREFRLGPTSDLDSIGEVVVTAHERKSRRLVSDQRYFGLVARVFRAGAQRLEQRIAAQPPDAVQIDLECLGADFLLGPRESLELLRAMLAGGLLTPDGNGYYRPTARFHDYAQAQLVAPLSRPRARALVDAVSDVVAQINADWVRNPFEVKLVAVSGSYMSRSDQLPELSVWLVLRPRPAPQSRRWRGMVSKGTGLRQILTAVGTLSSFIVARIVAHKNVVPRPFAVVFQAREALPESGVSASQRIREWGESIGELLGTGYYSTGRRGRGQR
jgi:hypothetical protein